MNLSRHAWLIALIAAMIVTSSAPLDAETVKFPKDKAAFTVDLQPGWKATEGGTDLMGFTLSVYQSGDSGKGQILISDAAKVHNSNGDKISVTEENAKTAVCEVAKSATLNVGPDATCSEPVESTVAGHPAYTIVATGKAMGEPATMQFTLFTPDGKKWFYASSMFGNVGQSEWGNKPLLDAIKSASGGSNDE